MVKFCRSVCIFQAVTVLIIRVSKNKKFCDQKIAVKVTNLVIDPHPVTT